MSSRIANEMQRRRWRYVHLVTLMRVKRAKRLECAEVAPVLSRHRYQGAGKPVALHTLRDYYAHPRIWSPDSTLDHIITRRQNPSRPVGVKTNLRVVTFGFRRGQQNDCCARSEPGLCLLNQFLANACFLVGLVNG